MYLNWILGIKIISEETLSPHFRGLKAWYWVSSCLIRACKGLLSCWFMVLRAYTEAWVRAGLNLTN
jgi:hypothetical protein